MYRFSLLLSMSLKIMVLYLKWMHRFQNIFYTLFVFNQIFNVLVQILIINRKIPQPNDCVILSFLFESYKSYIIFGVQNLTPLLFDLNFSGFGILFFHVFFHGFFWFLPIPNSFLFQYFLFFLSKGTSTTL